MELAGIIKNLLATATHENAEEVGREITRLLRQYTEQQTVIKVPEGSSMTAEEWSYYGNVLNVKFV